jgi:hypothetical protein
MGDHQLASRKVGKGGMSAMSSDFPLLYQAGHEIMAISRKSTLRSPMQSIPTNQTPFDSPFTAFVRVPMPTKGWLTVEIVIGAQASNQVELVRILTGFAIGKTLFVSSKERRRGKRRLTWSPHVRRWPDETQATQRHPPRRCNDGSRKRRAGISHARDPTLCWCAGR